MPRFWGNVNKNGALMDELSTVGKRLRMERTRLGYNTRDFAKAGGVGKGTQSRYENDETRPNADYLNRISALGAEIFWIMRGSAEDAAMREKDPPPYTSAIREMINDYLLCSQTVQDAGRLLFKEAADMRRAKVVEFKRIHGSAVETVIDRAGKDES
jgi:transcriptional regulator with XRE-family HTH domain